MTQAQKDPNAFRTISEAAKHLGLPQHVLRFWETKFTHIKPMKRAGGRRFYRPDDVHLLSGIRHLLYDKGYTIKGVQRVLKEKGVRHVIDMGELALSGRDTATPVASEPQEAGEPFDGSAAMHTEVVSAPEPAVTQTRAPEPRAHVPQANRDGALTSVFFDELAHIRDELLDIRALCAQQSDDVSAS